MKLKGTRIAHGMYNRRDHFNACIYGDIQNCIVECKYFNKGDESWRDDGNKNTVILLSPEDYMPLSEYGLKSVFEEIQEQAYLSGVVSYSRLTDDLQEKYRPAREDGMKRLKLLQEQRKAFDIEIDKLEKMLA